MTVSEVSTELPYCIYLSYVQSTVLVCIHCIVLIGCLSPFTGQPGPDKGTYRVHVIHQGTGQWYEMQDLHVRDILPQMITLSESYVQVYKLNSDVTNKMALATEDSMQQ